MLGVGLCCDVDAMSRMQLHDVVDQLVVVAADLRPAKPPQLCHGYLRNCTEDKHLYAAARGKAPCGKAPPCADCLVQGWALPMQAAKLT